MVLAPTLVPGTRYLRRKSLSLPGYWLEFFRFIRKVENATDTYIDQSFNECKTYFNKIGKIACFLFSYMKAAYKKRSE